MDFKEYVGRYRNDIYSTIMDYIPVKDPIEHYKIVREYSERMGNYRRPGLLMLCGEMYSATSKDLLFPAAAMQLSEDWILIHDDIEDDSELRRGKPALHKIYGNEIAINAGDAVHIAMWKLLKDFMQKHPDIGSKVYDKFYNMLEYTVEGQYIETNFIYNVRDLSKANEELYFRIINSKTCYYSVYGPMQLGAMAAGEPDSTLNMLKQIGEPAGIAFQVTDDILDMTADEATFGKQKYGDLYEGKLTLMILQAYGKATPEEKSKIDAIYKKRRNDKTKDEIMWLVDIINKYGGLDYARGIAEKYGAAAEAAVDKYSGIMPQNQFAATLLSAIQELYKRQK